MCNSVLLPPNALCPGFAQEYWCGRFGVSAQMSIIKKNCNVQRGGAHCSVAGELETNGS